MTEPRTATAKEDDMATTDDDFLKTTNPFSKLDRRRFADDRSTDRDSMQKERTLKNIQADIPKQFDGDDEALFLAAVGSIRKRPVEKAKPPRAGTTREPDFAEAMERSLGLRPSAGKPVPSKAPKAPARAVGPVPGRPVAKPPVIKAAPDDDAVFAEAMKDVKHLDGMPTVPAPKPTPPTAVPAFRSDRKPEDMDIRFVVASSSDYVEGHVVGLDLSTVARLQQGVERPETHTDLHGLNVVQACEQLIQTVRRAYETGKRVLLVVYGRGKNSPAGNGILRDKVPQWLTQDPFMFAVSAFCTATRADGGAGALYVLLRKRRKDGIRIPWDRRPPDSDLYL